jgi:hypothetical protein
VVTPGPLDPQVGQRVQVDVSGMQTTNGIVASGIVVPGTVTHIDAERRLTIRLDVGVDGHVLVTAPLGRIRSII